jgi:cyclophilin family peptidyl-prolyl cis-trans isomerase
MRFAKGPREARTPSTGKDLQTEEPAMNYFTLAVLALGLSAGATRAANPVVLISTSMGDIKVELDPEKAPITVKNFLDYVDDKHYDGTIFHRVIGNFMIQGGGMEANGRERPSKAPIKNEAANGLSNKRGTIAMARTSVPDSATAQFFINVKDNDFLDKAKAQDGHGYCVFGKVIDGIDVVDKIKAVKTKVGDVPVQPVVIKSIRKAE